MPDDVQIEICEAQPEENRTALEADRGGSAMAVLMEAGVSDEGSCVLSRLFREADEARDVMTWLRSRRYSRNIECPTPHMTGGCGIAALRELQVSQGAETH